MSNRQVHSVFEMIALTTGGKTLATTPENFRQLFEKHLPNLDGIQHANYMLSLSMPEAVLREYRSQIPIWDAALVAGVQRSMHEVGSYFSFNFNATDSLRYLPDLLEVFRANHLGEFAWSLDNGVDDEADAIFTVQTYDAPGFFDRLTKREREPRSKHMFKASSLRGASGTSTRFKLECGGFSINFSPDGGVIKTPHVHQ
ncbi:hypothetical protein F3K36_25920 [Delftia sp. BR1]|nr:hypothetical protein F3K36_25920 [Delftia sp. BR1]